MDYICPETGNKIRKLGTYIRYNHHKYSSKEYLMYLVYKQTIPSVVENFKELYEMGGTLPFFKREYGLSYKSTCFLISYLGIEKRSRSKSCIIGSAKAKKTNLDRYGVDQTFKVPEFDKKRKKRILIGMASKIHLAKEHVWKI